MIRNLFFVFCLSLSPYLQATESQSKADSINILQQHWQQQPKALETAIPLAAAYLKQAQLIEDRSYLQKVREVLNPWWTQTNVPAKLRLLRAQWYLQHHHLNNALQDLQSLNENVLKPLDYQESLLLSTKIHRLQGNYDTSRKLCIELGRRTNETLRALCLGSTLSLLGRHEQAYFILNDAAYDSIAMSPRRYQWVRTEMAVLNHRFGQPKMAEKNFRIALEQKLPNHYLWRAYGDFLLNQGQAEKLLWELPEASPDAGVQLRRLLAMQVLEQDISALTKQLLAQFQRASQQDDKSLLTEEARFNLEVLNKPQNALKLAQEAWTVYKTPELSVVYLRAALAAQQSQAAQEVLNWINQYEWNDQVLVKLQAKFK